MSRNLYLWLAVFIAFGAGGFFLGRGLRPAAEAAFASDQRAAAYDAAPSIAGRSRGGFSGFGDLPGLDGATVLAGEVAVVTSDTVTLKGAAGTEPALRVSAGSALRRIEAATTAALRPGVSIVVRTATDGATAEAVLIVAEP